MVRNLRFVRGLMVGAILSLSASAWAVDTSDWDWGAVESEEEAPVTSSRRDSMPTRSEPAPPPIAEPDLQAEPRDAYALFKDMPSFQVIPSTKDREMHPCGNCHRWAESDPTPRPLKEPHNNFALQHGLHGRGQFWCFTCHDLSGDGNLRTLKGEPLDYDEAYLLCSQCHVDQGRDWAYGAHGKRHGNWQGERLVYNCTACHYQHAPAFPGRSAMSGPKVRQGLDRPGHWVPKEQRAHPLFEPHRPWQAEQSHE